jgi:hypothetical protein
LAADRQDQGDTRLTLTPSVIPNSNYVIMVSDWSCLKYFLRVFCTVIIRCTETFWSPSINLPTFRRNQMREHFASLPFCLRVFQPYDDATIRTYKDTENATLCYQRICSGVTMCTNTHIRKTVRLSLRVEVPDSFENSVPTYQTTRCFDMNV